MAKKKSDELAAPVKLLTVSEAAERLNTSSAYLYKLMDIGGIEYVQLPGNSVTDRKVRRISEKVIDNLISDGTVSRRADLERASIYLKRLGDKERNG